MNKILTSALTLTLALASQFANAQYTRNGSATNISTTARPNSFQLTPNTATQNGTVWNNTKLDIANNSFELSFKANFGTKDADGADGIALVFQNSTDGVAALGTGTMGQFMGFQGISPSLNIEFDTYNNGATAGDIAADHISISKNGSTNAGNQLTTAVQASASNANIEDGQDHSVVVSWDAAAKTMSVSFDGSLRQTYTDNVVANIFGGHGSVLWGFTASTGGSYNRHAVYQLSLVVTPVSKAITPLPVSLVKFNAAAAEKSNVLTWATASEKNSAYFQVERSADAKNWNLVTKVNGNGNSNTFRNYTATDLKPAAGLNYYRLKMVDLDGTFEYSNVVTLRNNQVNQASLTAYPNPVQNSETLKLNFLAAENVSYLRILDMAGAVVKAEKVTATPGQASVALNIQNLKPGLYLVQLANGTSTETVKVLVK